MAYLGHVDDPFFLCDSTDSSDLTNSAASVVPPCAKMTKNTSAKHSVFPVLPAPHNLSALANPEQFPHYASAQLPSVVEGDQPMPPASGIPLQTPTTAGVSGAIRTKVNSTFLNTLLVSRDVDKNRHNILVPTDWVEKVVFTDKKLPFAFLGDELLDKKICKVWNEDAKTAISYADDMSEERVANWLSFLAHNVGFSHGCTVPAQPQRAFNCNAATRPAAGSFMARKPDICVLTMEEHLAKKADEPIHWRNVYAFVEVTSNQSSPCLDLTRQITQKASCLFDVQPQRRFVCALGLWGQPEELFFTFIVVDRAGLVSTHPAALTDPFRFLTFLRILYAFSYADESVLGWDSSMAIHPTTRELTSITITEKSTETPAGETKRRFEIIKALHSSPILFGRGTRVWIVRDEEGKLCVLKDSWILVQNMTSEIAHVKRIDHAIKTDPVGHLLKHICPSYVAGEEMAWSTDYLRPQMKGPPARHRRRIVTQTIGDPITSFRSKKEFVSVFLDLVNGLEFLNKNVGVVHGDLSFNNVMINRIWKYKPGESPSELRNLYPPPVESSNDDVSPPSSNLPSAEITSSMILDVAPPPVAPPPVAPPPVTPPVVGPEGTYDDVEATGMLIDCDFMRLNDEKSHQTSGTLPFMSIEALRPTPTREFIHRGGHDLECLLNTMITICHYVVGPGALRTPLAVDDTIQLNEWFTMHNRLKLAATKSITLEAYDTFIKPVLPPYWQDFSPFLHSLIKATYSGMPYLEHRNVATHEAYRKILKDALALYQTSETAQLTPYAVVPTAKRPSEAATSAPQKKQKVSKIPQLNRSYGVESWAQFTGSGN